MRSIALSFVVLACFALSSVAYAGGGHGSFFQSQAVVQQHVVVQKVVPQQVVVQKFVPQQVVVQKHVPQQVVVQKFVPQHAAVRQQVIVNQRRGGVQVQSRVGRNVSNVFVNQRRGLFRR